VEDLTIFGDGMQTPVRSAVVTDQVENFLDYYIPILPVNIESDEITIKGF
jgi:hypothetical protein